MASIIESTGSDERTRDLTPERFRVLICGRANAGKTTILKRLCGAADGEDPIVNWKKGGRDALNPTEGRGAHNINDEITFKSNPGYVFHDSCGIESGGDAEVDELRSFIKKRAHTGDFQERLHIIWLCISADSDRPLLEGGAEMNILQNKVGQVPILVIFTKCEALEIKALTTLQQKGLNDEQCWQQAPKEAQLVLKKEFYDRLTAAGHPLTQIVELRHMDRPAATCAELVSATEQALDDATVVKLFLVTERFNIDETAAIAIRREIQASPAANFDSLVLQVLAWFPHNWCVVSPLIIL